MFLGSIYALFQRLDLYDMLHKETHPKGYREENEPERHVPPHNFKPVKRPDWEQIEEGYPAV
jgi:hypothetical protein